MKHNQQLTNELSNIVSSEFIRANLHKLRHAKKLSIIDSLSESLTDILSSILGRVQNIKFDNSYDKKNIAIELSSREINSKLFQILKLSQGEVSILLDESAALFNKEFTLKNIDGLKLLSLLTPSATQYMKDLEPSMVNSVAGELMYFLYQLEQSNPKNNLELRNLSANILEFINLNQKKLSGSQYETELADVATKCEKILNIHSRDYYNKLQSNSLKDRSKTLTEYEDSCIRLMSKKNPNVLEKSLIEDFLIYVVDNNKTLNTRLNNTFKDKESSIFFTEHLKTIENLSKLSYKIAHYEHTFTTVLKLRNTMLNIDNGFNIQKSDRINLKDYGALIKLSDIYPQLQSYVDSGLIKTGGRNSDALMQDANILVRLYAMSSIANDLVTKIDNSIMSEKQFKVGDIVMDVNKKFEDVFTPKSSLFTRIKNKFVKYSHAANYFSDNYSNELSHMTTGAYRVDPLASKRIISSDSFRIQPINLIQNDSILAKIAKAYGISPDNKEEISNMLEDKFQDHARKIHCMLRDGQLGTGLKNMQKTQFIAGASSLGFITSKADKELREWADAVISQKNINVSQVKGREVEEGVICSGLTAKTLVLTLLSLEKEIEKELRNKGLESSTHAFQLPFHKHRDLSKVTTDDLIKELKASNAVVIIPKPEIVTQIFRS